MHIALVYDAVYPFVTGGVERRNYAVAAALADDHRVALYGFHYWKDDGGGRLPNCQYVSVGRPMDFYGPNGRRRIREAIGFAGKLVMALWRGEEDVWDVANFPFFSVPAAWLASRARGRKLVVTWHEYWGEHWYEYLGWLGRFGKHVERLALACSPHIITVSEHTRRRLIEAGYPVGRIDVVPNGVDLEDIRRVSPNNESSDLIFVGRLLPHKRVDLAIEALAVVRRRRPDATLTVIGDGPERARLESLAGQLGLAHAVRFLGVLPQATDVYARLKSSRVLVMPSQREGFGIAVIEGWGCGIPAVVCQASQSALPELIDNEDKGRVVPGSGEAIGGACLELLQRPRSAVQSRLELAAADYDWRRVAARLETVYQKLLQE